jgi:hypothetical protein
MGRRVAITGLVCAGLAWMPCGWSQAGAGQGGGARAEAAGKTSAETSGQAAGQAAGQTSPNTSGQASGPAAAGPAGGSGAGQGAGASGAKAENAGASPYTVPAGTKVLLSLKSAINTKTTRPGDGVYLVSTFPVTVGPRVLIPAGVYVQGVVDAVERPGRVKGRAKLLMHFTTMIFPSGQVVEIPGMVNSLPGSAGPKVKDGEGTVEQAGNKGRDLGNIAKAAGMGAEGGVIGGGVSGRPLAGVAYGGLAGAAAGAIYTLFTRGDEIAIPQGTGVEMVLQRPLNLEPAAAQGESGGAQFVPAANQPKPLPKPGHVLCPPDSLGCN